MGSVGSGFFGVDCFCKRRHVVRAGVVVAGIHERSQVRLVVRFGYCRDRFSALVCSVWFDGWEEVTHDHFGFQDIARGCRLGSATWAVRWRNATSQSRIRFQVLGPGPMFGM
uniref:(northern house mosquito) hypothetical protein n=1 Tax=Culex pipiens TaxID=7175 RepID=A0A8D8FY41_CULPI